MIQSLSEGIYPFCSLSSAVLLGLSEGRWGPAGIGLNSASKLQVLSLSPSVSPVSCPSEAILTPLQEQMDLACALAGAWPVPCFPCRINLQGKPWCKVKVILKYPPYKRSAPGGFLALPKITNIVLKGDASTEKSV